MYHKEEWNLDTISIVIYSDTDRIQIDPSIKNMIMSLLGKVDRVIMTQLLSTLGCLPIFFMNNVLRLILEPTLIKLLEENINEPFKNLENIINIAIERGIAPLCYNLFTNMIEILLQDYKYPTIEIDSARRDLLHKVKRFVNNGNVGKFINLLTRLSDRLRNYSIIFSIDRTISDRFLYEVRYVKARFHNNLIHFLVFDEYLIDTVKSFRCPRKVKIVTHDCESINISDIRGVRVPLRVADVVMCCVNNLDSTLYDLACKMLEKLIIDVPYYVNVTVHPSGEVRLNVKYVVKGSELTLKTSICKDVKNVSASTNIRVRIHDRSLIPIILVPEGYYQPIELVETSRDLFLLLLQELNYGDTILNIILDLAVNVSRIKLPEKKQKVDTAWSLAESMLPKLELESRLGKWKIHARPSINMLYIRCRGLEHMLNEVLIENELEKIINRLDKPIGVIIKAETINELVNKIKQLPTKIEQTQNKILII